MPNTVRVDEYTGQVCYLSGRRVEAVELRGDWIGYDVLLEGGKYRAAAGDAVLQLDKENRHD